MFRKMLFLSLVAIAFAIASFLSFGGINLAFAQEETPPRDTACIDCHLDQYWLYDSGKSYCLIETKVRCTECHHGRTETAVKELAHEGLIANPVVNDAAICQECHHDDYRSKVQKFASIAGVSPTPVPYSTCTPSALVSQTSDGAGGSRFLRGLPSGPMQAAGAALLGTAFLVVFLFACRCWQIDRVSRLKGQGGG
jgi:hypothetical protein